MATIRDGQVLAEVTATYIDPDGSRIVATIASATYKGAQVDVHDGVFIYVNPPGSSALQIQKYIGDTVRHLAGD